MTCLVRTFASVSVVLASVALACPASAGPLEGFWKELDVEDPVYASYLKVEADSGYYCVMDGKSSFRFKIVGDSITTPMNGKDAFALTSPGRLRIHGEEKGDPYQSTFARMDPGEYPNACVDEERDWYGGPTALSGGTAKPTRAVHRPAAGPGAWGHRGHRGDFLDALGRIRRAP